MQNNQKIRINSLRIHQMIYVVYIINQRIKFSFNNLIKSTIFRWSSSL